MKDFNNLTLSELIELKTASDFISEEYAKELTDYATVNKDPYFQRLTSIEQSKYEKRLKSQKLSNKIRNRIEELIENYYD